jgi:hypothetical protein
MRHGWEKRLKAARRGEEAARARHQPIRYAFPDGCARTTTGQAAAARPTAIRTRAYRIRT